MVPDSNQSDPGERRRKTVLPPRRNPPPKDLREVPLRKGEANELRRERAGGEGPAERGAMPASAPPVPPGEIRPRRSKLGVVIFSVIVPAAVLALLILLVNRLDDPREELVKVTGGEVHWFSDGLIGIQEDPDSDQRVYYLIEVPPASDPQVRFGDRSMTLLVRTADGLRDLSRPVDWSEAPYAMLIHYLDRTGETPKVPCQPGTIEEYVETAGPSGSVAVLAARLRQSAAGARP